MFCSKCGREIRNDSIYCSYCGVAVEDPEEDTREIQKETKGQDACVRPGAPKKHCIDCNKELPSSSISDICALCAIRRRNRELEERKNRSTNSAAKDRYDISDEFDQSVFSGTSYYKGEELAEPEYRKTLRPNRSSTRMIVPLEANAAGKGCLVLFGLIAALLLVLVAILSFGAFGKSEMHVSLSPEPVYSESVLENEPVAFHPSAPDDLKAQIATAAQHTLADYLPEDAQTIEITNDSFDYTGEYLCYAGEANSIPFSMTMLITEYEYGVLRLDWNGETIYDITYAVGPDGKITAEGAVDLDAEEGEDYFPNPVILPEYLF